jgi:hypothetical protein
VQPEGQGDASPSGGLPDFAAMTEEQYMDWKLQNSVKVSRQSTALRLTKKAILFSLHLRPIISWTVRKGRIDIRRSRVFKNLACGAVKQSAAR